MKMLLIMNPGSKSGQGKKLWHIWKFGLRKKQVDFEIAYTKNMQDAFDYAKNANDFDTIVAVGGDGTINAVANGIMQAKNPNIKMGILYAGTSPDFCKFHNIPTDPKKSLETLIKGSTENIDVGKITYQNDNKESHFVCSCNIGLGASVARYANRWRKYLGDHLGTGLATLHSFITCHKLDLELSFNDKTFTFAKNNNFSVIINPYIASGLKLKINKTPNDGNLWILGINKKNVFGLLGTLPKYYSGKIINDPNILLERTTDIVIKTKHPQEIEFDGDPHGHLPIKIELLPKALKLIKESP